MNKKCDICGKFLKYIKYTDEKLEELINNKILDDFDLEEAKGMGYYYCKNHGTEGVD